MSGCLAARRPAAPASSQNQRRHTLQVAAIAAPLKDRETLPSPSSLERELQQRLANSTPAPAATGRRVVLESADELKSTWEHRAWVGGATALMGATLAGGLGQVDGIGGVVEAGVAVCAAYALADLGTAFYHFFVDNYGDASTPVFGGQIAAFQGHHQRPWTITEREFSNNVHKLFKPAAPFAAVLALSAAAGAPVWWDVWSSSFLFLCCMSQQFHAWSHMKRSELPPAVVALQESGLLISRKAHGAHHKSPFNCNYSIVSGMWNPVLDGDNPETSVWMRLERYIHSAYGVEPRSWYEPEQAWQEQQRPGAPLS
ncbi:hypothetical protein D9Q98_003706 [Chlorella vulgaris]|uniref:Lipid desaturase domain-containing protein n=1 Tax=Chlorella vulgaris TaxID=3077 RepID=A0A9D4TT28_CHLVU|nr:hypothetical protein D9Q98_003706 [Chlorella vulgaris]